MLTWQPPVTASLFKRTLHVCAPTKRPHRLVTSM
jgi:hypothetical protein